MGVRHVVMFELTDPTPETLEELRQAADAMAGEISEVLGYTCGPDLGLSEGNCDFAVVADFADEAGYATFRDHPAHTAFVAEHVRPRLVSRSAVQFAT